MIRPFFQGEHVDAMLRRLRKEVDRGGTMFYARRAEAFVSRPERLRKKQNAARRRALKQGRHE